MRQMTMALVMVQFICSLSCSFTQLDVHGHTAVGTLYLFGLSLQGRGTSDNFNQLSGNLSLTGSVVLQVELSNHV